MARNMKFAKVSAIATCSIIVLAITSLVFALTMSPPEELAAINRANVISQIKQDWTARPFVKIESFDDACPDGWDPVFDRVWKGIDQGCLVDYQESVYQGGKYKGSVPRTGIATTYEMDNFRRGSDEVCRLSIAEVNPISQTDFGGKSVCGVRGGLSFSEVLRPNLQNECPSGTSACSQTTNSENTVCYPPEQHDDACPITEIKFVQN